MEIRHYFVHTAQYLNIVVDDSVQEIISAMLIGKNQSRKSANVD